LSCPTLIEHEHDKSSPRNRIPLNRTAVVVVLRYMYLDTSLLYRGKEVHVFRASVHEVQHVNHFMTVFLGETIKRPC